MNVKRPEYNPLLGALNKKNLPASKHLLNECGEIRIDPLRETLNQNKKKP
jgi:hypothetical protein